MFMIKAINDLLIIENEEKPVEKTVTTKIVDPNKDLHSNEETAKLGGTK